jgi:hypothetical protein
MLQVVSPLFGYFRFQCQNEASCFFMDRLNIQVVNHALCIQSVEGWHSFEALGKPGYTKWLDLASMLTRLSLGMLCQYDDSKGVVGKPHDFATL